MFAEPGNVHQNVLLSGERGGTIRSWNLSTLTEGNLENLSTLIQGNLCTLKQEHQHKRDRYHIKSIAVNADGSSICVVNSKAHLYDYRYIDQKGWTESVVQCSFPRLAAGLAAIAYDESIGEYDPILKEITWTKRVSDYLNSKINCSALREDATTTFSGHDRGNVIAFMRNGDAKKIIRLKLEGDISSMY